jgi:hypothetical protein
MQVHRLFLVLVFASIGTALAILPKSLAAQPDIGRFDAACSGDNPFFVTTCYTQGILPDDPALVAFRNTPDGSDHHVLATQAQIGAAYGIAYRASERALYIGAYHKRGTAFGPGGPGMVYRMDLNTGAVEPWLALPNPGADTHDPDDNYWPDTPARNGAGLISLGDLDLSENGEVLNVMHLPDRKIYRYRVDDKAFLGTIDIGSTGQPWASQARPFGLASWNGKLYHGVVHSSYQSQDDDDLQAYVYETDPDGSNVRLVTQFSLIYERGNVFGNISARWKPWVNNPQLIGPGALGGYPQPMLTDIEFADNGDMIFGLRDRLGDMTFFNPGGRNPPNEGTGIPAGDILIGRYNGTTWDVAPEPEFFSEDFGPNRNGHDETGFGGLARMRDANVVVSTGLAPLRISSGGAYWFDMSSGATLGREELYNFESEVNFGKANGLGDVELLCGPEQATETPTPTETATETVTATVTLTPTVTSSATATVATITPSSTATQTALPTVTATNTATALATPTGTVRSTDRPGSTPNPTEAPTTELPGLPQTGFGNLASGGTGWLLAVGLIAAIVAAEFYRRRRAARDAV